MMSIVNRIESLIEHIDNVFVNTVTKCPPVESRQWCCPDKQGRKCIEGCMGTLLKGYNNKQIQWVYRTNGELGDIQTV